MDYCVYCRLTSGDFYHFRGALMYIDNNISSLSRLELQQCYHAVEQGIEVYN